MRNIKQLLVLTGLVVSTCGAYGCVTDRPARNGVFNENVYLRKDFLVRSGDADDKGNEQTAKQWQLKATITDTSSPNPLGGLDFWPGVSSLGQIVQFRVSQDHLEMIDPREVSSETSTGRIPEVVDSWSATNVDLKYRVNLDGEQTNFYEENQELPWEQRQWVKLNLAKNDLSDVAALGNVMSYYLNVCAITGEASTTMVPDSVVVDEANQYVQWKVRITVPVRIDDPGCAEAYGPAFQPALQLNRPNVTMELMYSLERVNENPTYQPVLLEEKDPIRRKYGVFTNITEARDNVSGQLAARELMMRFDPQKNFTWYFDKGFPEKYKSTFLRAGGIKDQTNAILEKAGAAGRVDFRNYDDPEGETELQKERGGREFGDVRYSWLRWMADRDMQPGFAGVTQFNTDQRTGETLTSSIVLNDFQIKDYYVERIDAFLQSVGASLDVNSDKEWADGPKNCKDGDTMPIVPQSPDTNPDAPSLQQVAAKSTLFNKMQQYLGKSVDKYGPLGPHDFIQKQDDDFFKAYYAILPYQVFADPDMNPFVVREGGAGVYGADSVRKMQIDESEFHKRAADIDHGLEPYEGVTGPDGIKNAASFLNRMRDLTVNHRKLGFARMAQRDAAHRAFDSNESFSFETVIARDARHCVADSTGATHWETKDEWVQNLIDTYWEQVIWHEFGHALGLEHNFMASVDKPNFPTYQDKAGRTHYGLFASSVMEYNASPDRVFWHPGWAPYDSAALGFIYANNGANPTPNAAATASVSGQTSPTAPWKDPLGFSDDGKTEKQFLFCTHQHLEYTPFCREGDMGTTPSEIIANQLEMYEWQFNWRNFRVYRKFWDNARYADSPAGLIVDMRRFLSAWEYDWSGGELTDTLRRIGFKNPDPNGSDANYFAQLTNKFDAEMSAANQMVAAFHKAVIQQGSGERPFATVYDRYFGDVTQQGIILDKLFAMVGFVGMWPTDNYDQNQAGAYFASYSGLGDASYRAVSEDAVDSMIGGQYNVYPYFRPLAVVLFAQDTHDPSFSGRLDVRDWVGGQTFGRLEDFLDYFRNIAVANDYKEDGCDTGFDTCQYDPRVHGDDHAEFIGPDKRTWIWAFIPDRNQYVAVLKDRNTASYVIVRNYNDDVLFQQDDGAFPGGAYGNELPMKYFLDSFNTYR